MRGQIHGPRLQETGTAVSVGPARRDPLVIHGADARARDCVGLYPELVEDLEHEDMGQAFRTTASEGKSDFLHAPGVVPRQAWLFQALPVPVPNGSLGSTPSM